jgi:predicted nuclease of predicted toxin-antitoxin system
LDFEVDENLPVEVADLLRHAGYDAITVVQQNLAGSPDPHIASVCHQEERVLVTLDTDFDDIRAYPPAQFPGFFVLHLRRQDKPHVLDVLGRLISVLSREALEHRLWIVEETRLRIRD